MPCLFCGGNGREVYCRVCMTAPGTPASEGWLPPLVESGLPESESIIDEPSPEVPDAGKPAVEDYSYIARRLREITP